MEAIDKPVHWRAIYKGGEVLEQLGNTQEILYDNIDKKDLKEFFLLGCLVDVGVNLEKGTLSINGKEVAFPTFSNLALPYRLIYFVKTSGVLGSKQHKTYCVGLQTTVEKKNLKTLVELTSNRVTILTKWKEIV